MEAAVTARLELPERLDAVTLADLRQAALAARGSDLVLDGSAVRRAGGLGLQFLLAARAAWDAGGHVLSLADPSEPLQDALRTLGAPHLLDAASDDASRDDLTQDDVSADDVTDVGFIVLPTLEMPAQEQPGDLA